MKLSGHTPLARIESVSVQQKSLLSSLWIESVEEFTALMAAMDSADTTADSATLSSLKKNETELLKGIPKERLAPWQCAIVGGSMGCQIEPQVLAVVKAHGRISLPGSVAPQLSNAPLPPSVRLMGDLFPIRDQGHRGTCVAFASVALREFIDGCSVELSEQFLYWACKKLDGRPDEAGTYVHTAMSALSVKGVCSRQEWPYNPDPKPGDESHGAFMPVGVEQSALDFVMPNSRSVAPNCVNHYKQILAGADGRRAMPVVIASLVFNSWACSAATNQTGKITMPLPGEQPLPGGHAMAIVGYQDDSSVPGGGYFIVRNSWGNAWAARSPEAVGHAMMPYAYVEQFIVEAFSGQTVDIRQDNEPDFQRQNILVSPNSHSFEERFARTLRQGMRDIEGKLLQAGSRIICHPEAPEEAMADTAANRAQFERLHFAWSDRVRRLSGQARK